MNVSLTPVANTVQLRMLVGKQREGGPYQVLTTAHCSPSAQSTGGHKWGTQMLPQMGQLETEARVRRIESGYKIRKHRDSQLWQDVWTRPQPCKSIASLPRVCDQIS